jgi:hypothetical protein
MWSTPPADPPPILLQLGNEIIDGLDRRIRRHGDGTRVVDQSDERRHVVQRDGRIVQENTADENRAHRHDRVVVALVVVDELGKADRAAGAALVRELGAVGEDAGLLHRLEGQPRHGVVAAARPARGHDGRRVGGSRCRQQRQRECSGGEQTFHQASSWL